MAYTDRERTVIPYEPMPRATGERDSRNIDRTWRIWKAMHLVRNPKTLSRILGRRA